MPLEELTLFDVDRRTVAAIALVKGVAYAKALETAACVRCLFPLGARELELCLDLWKHRDVLLKEGGDRRRRRREVDRAVAAARAAAPRILVARAFEDVEAAATAIAAATSAGFLSTRSPRSSEDFSREVAAEGARNIARPVGASGSSLFFDWDPAGDLGSRLRRRTSERDLKVWARGLAAALAAVHYAGLVLDGPTPDGIFLRDSGSVWDDEEAVPQPRLEALLWDFSRAAAAAKRDGNSRGVDDDVWRLGCVLWQAATRENKIPGVDDVEMIPRRFDDDLKRGIRVALAREATAEELFYVLDPDRAARRLSMLSPPLDLGVVAVEPTIAKTKKKDHPEPSPPKQREIITVPQVRSEALPSKDRSVERARRYRRQSWWRNLPGVRRARIERRRAARLAARRRERRLAVSRHCALVVFWSAADVASWARLAARRAVDARVILHNNNNNIIQRGDDPTTSRQIFYPAEEEVARMFSTLDAARQTGDDARRAARKTVADAVGARNRNLKLDEAAAAAAVELVHIDRAAERYCGALGSCLLEAGITGATVVAAVTPENSSRSLAVAALARSLRDTLRETVARAESNDELDEAELERQVFVLALVLYDAYGATRERGVEARDDAAARIQARSRGARVRRILARVWKEADALCEDELRARRASDEARRAAGKKLPRSPPTVVVERTAARHAIFALSPPVLDLARAVPCELSLRGWLSSSSNSPLVVLEIGTNDDDEPPDALFSATVDGLSPATSYLVVLRPTPLTRIRLKETADRDRRHQDAFLALARDDELDAAGVLAFETLPSTPDSPAPPRVTVVRLRGPVDTRSLVDVALTNDSSKVLLVATATDVTTAVHVSWDPPANRGAPIQSYVCERACKTPWLRLRTVNAGITDVVDLPSLSEVWSYRIAAVNRLGRSEFSPPTRVQISSEPVAPPYFDIRKQELAAKTMPSPPQVKDIDAGFRDAYAHGIYFKTFDVETPLPRSTMTSTFR